MRIINRYTMRLLLGGVILGLAACGGRTLEATQTTAPAPRSTVPATSVTALHPTTARSAAPSASPTMSATEMASSPEATAEVGAVDRPYAVLPQSKTPEGYYVLGQPDAPIVLTHYSDFL